MKLNVTPQERGRIWAKIAVRGPDECWKWKGHTFKKRGGYGMVVFRSKTWRAHRLVYFIERRILASPKILLCHRCDDVLCCNPGHLFEGDHQANADDMYQKGRGRKAYGSKTGNAKLTESIVIDIRRAFLSGAKIRALARRYNVSKPAIQQALKGGTWRHVPISAQDRAAINTKFRAQKTKAANKLTAENVTLIRSERQAKGASYAELAARFGVTASHIWAICVGKLWKS